VTTHFYRVGSLVPRPTPNPEDQGISRSLAPPSKPVRHGWPYQQLCCRRHSCTQAPSPSNKLLSTRRRYHRGGPLCTVNCNKYMTLIFQCFHTYVIFNKYAYCVLSLRESLICPSCNIWKDTQCPCPPPPIMKAVFINCHIETTWTVSLSV
jgi:hypothetical protein